MNKISAYVLLIFIFLGISKSFSPSEQGSVYVLNEQVLPNYFQGSPLSIILVDSFQAGFIIKTYFQKYRIIYGFDFPKEMVVKTSYSFWSKNKKNLGMSIFRRSEQEEESSLQLPPGSLYIGDPAYGYWKLKSSGNRIWFFHRAYKHFPKIFGWNQYQPNLKFFNKMKYHQEQNIPFYGVNNEFGTEGKITKKYLSPKKKEKEATISWFKRYLKKYLTIIPWNKAIKK